MSGIYKNIEKYRIINGISKMDFYDLIGLSSTGYAAMVKNNSIKFSTLILIADKLKVSLPDLIKDEIKASLSKLPQNEKQSVKSAGTYAINPSLLEPEMINAVSRLPISDAEKMAIINDKVSLLQLHLKTLIQKNETLELETERFQQEIDRLVQ